MCSGMVARRTSTPEERLVSVRKRMKQAEQDLRDLRDDEKDLQAKIAARAGQRTAQEGTE